MSMFRAIGEEKCLQVAVTSVMDNKDETYVLDFEARKDTGTKGQKEDVQLRSAYFIFRSYRYDSTMLSEKLKHLVRSEHLFSVQSVHDDFSWDLGLEVEKVEAILAYIRKQTYINTFYSPSREE